jgi:DNA primase
MKDEKQKHYFSQTGLQNLKSDIDLASAIGAKVKLTRKGTRFFGNCPFHNDKDNSLVISPKKNLWYCFGGCKKGGSIIDWVMAYEKLKLVEALADLAERYPFLAQRGQMGNQGLNETVPEQCDLPGHQQILLQIVEHYHSCLSEQSRAIRYLRSQGISRSKAKKHKIGYCDGRLARAFIGRTQAGDEIMKARLEEMGLLQTVGDDRIQERFYGQIIFPLFDEKGQCMGLFGRAIPEASARSPLTTRKIKNAHTLTEAMAS